MADTLTALTEVADRFRRSTAAQRKTAQDAARGVVQAFANLVYDRYGYPEIEISVERDPAGGVANWIAPAQPEDDDTMLFDDVLDGPDSAAAAEMEKTLETVEAAIATLERTGYPSQVDSWARWASTVAAEH